MLCPKCGEELVFIYDGNYHVYHFSEKVNICDRNIFRAGAVVREPSKSTARRLAKQITECPRDYEKIQG